MDIKASTELPVIPCAQAYNRLLDVHPAHEWLCKQRHPFVDAQCPGLVERLPQRHCLDTKDHPAHDWGWMHVQPDVRCPGRHTGHGFTSNATPITPADDPFDCFGEEPDLWAEADYQRDATK